MHIHLRKKTQTLPAYICVHTLPQQQLGPIIFVL